MKNRLYNIIYSFLKKRKSTLFLNLIHTIPRFQKLKKKIEVYHASKSFYSSFIQPNDVCIDVGANIGNRVEVFLGLGAKVIAIEPQEYCVDFLKKKYGDRIILIPKGVGSKIEKKNLFICDANTLSSFSESWISSVKETRFKEFQWDTKKEVEMTTLDCIVQQYGIPSFIKIDVEGYELEVLEGLNYPINTISFEYSTPENTQKALDCLEILEKRNEKIECNYSIGESMKLELPRWLSPTEMKNLIISDRFTSTNFGDIYVRKYKNTL